VGAWGSAAAGSHPCDASAVHHGAPKKHPGVGHWLRGTGDDGGHGDDADAGGDDSQANMENLLSSHGWTPASSSPSQDH